MKLSGQVRLAGPHIASSTTSWASTV